MTIRDMIEAAEKVRRMKEQIDRQFPIAREALRLEQQWRQMAPTHSLVEELARSHEEMTKIAGMSSLKQIS